MQCRYLESGRQQEAYLAKQGLTIASLREDEQVYNSVLRELLSSAAGEAFEAANLLSKAYRAKPSIITDEQARLEFLTEIADVQLFILAALNCAGFSYLEFEKAVRDKQGYNSIRADHKLSQPSQ